MKIKNGIIPIMAVLMAGFFLTACMKAPDSVHSSGIKIDYALADSKEIYTINFSGALRNEDSSVAMKNVKGAVGIVDPDTGKALITLPFEFEVILPYSTGVLDLKMEKNEDEISQLLDYLKVDRETLMEEGSTAGQFLQDEQVRLLNLKFEKEDITKLLQEKI